MSTNLGRALTQPAEETFALLGSAPQGLTQTAAEARLQEVGPNRLETGEATAAWRIFLGQFADVLIWLLIASSVVAFALGETVDALAITAVVLLNAVLGFVQEWRAERSLEALSRMLSHKVNVRRDNRVRGVNVEDLVPGDVVLLESGMAVPADARVLEASELQVSEAVITGESAPVEKRAQAPEVAPEPIHESPNMVLANSTVVRGRGAALVLATGANTRIGQIAGLMQRQERGRTPLQAQLDTLGKKLGAGTIIVIVLLTIFGFLFWRMPFLELLLTSVTLAAAGIPEGLPTVVTVTLALGMRRMAKERALVRRLASVETLGSTTVICTDKTGTLTENELEVARVVTVERDEAWHAHPMDEGQVSGHVQRAAVLCNDASPEEDTEGDPLEKALVRMFPGIEPVDAVRAAWPRVCDLPFDSDRKIMITVHQRDADLLATLKGAPERVLERCNRWLSSTGEQPLTAEVREKLLSANQSMAQEALRVLAVAERTPSSASDLAAEGEHWVFLGLIGMRETVRAAVPQALKDCRTAGIRVMMMTGDQVGTARAVGRKLGFTGMVAEGAELSAVAEGKLAYHLRETNIVARVQPEHKFGIVKALQAEGEVVAVTGDGVNDAPALKAADIGVAMGQGSEVAKEAADMVLTDNNFATIAGAVREGRAIYDNIVRFVRFQVSTNVGAVLTVFLAPVFGLPLPFSPAQLLWINLIMDGPPAMALGLEEPAEDVMRRPPRPRGGAVLTWTRLGLVLFHGAIMCAGTLGLVALFADGGDSEVKTGAFTAFVAFQVFHVFNVRRDGTALTRKSFTNARLWAALAVVVLLHVLIVYLPGVGVLFHTQPISLKHFGIAVAVGASILVADELRKLALRLIRRVQHAG